MGLLPKGFNLVNLLGMLNRDNTGFSLYDDNPGLYDQLGESGVKFVDTPGLFTKQPYTIGNTVFAPKGMMEKTFPAWLDEQGLFNKSGQANTGLYYQNTGEFIAGEEVPHVSQYRDKGLLGFIMDYGKGLFGHGGTGDLYKDPNSMEGFHYMDLNQKADLYENVAGNYPFQRYNVSGKRWER